MRQLRHVLSTGLGLEAESRRSNVPYGNGSGPPSPSVSQAGRRQLVDSLATAGSMDFPINFHQFPCLSWPKRPMSWPPPGLRRPPGVARSFHFGPRPPGPSQRRSRNLMLGSEPSRSEVQRCAEDVSAGGAGAKSSLSACEGTVWGRKGHRVRPLSPTLGPRP